MKEWFLGLHPALKVALLVALLLILFLASLIPAWRPCFDFAQTGGYVLVYEVGVTGGQDADKVIDRVIEVLEERVDPHGVRGITFRRFGEKQIEIRMPVPLQVRRQRRTYLDARHALLASNIDEARLDQILDLPMMVPATPNGSIAPSLLFREQAWRRLREANPDLAGQIESLANAYDAYERAKDPLGGPEDLMRLLRGAGVLEFRIAVDAIDPQGVNPNDLRAQLAERGAANTDSSVARFFEINDLSQWYHTPDQLAALQADPVTYFRSAPWNLVAGERDLKYYLLLYTTDDKTITPEQDRTWSVVGTSLTVDNLGRDAILFRLDAPGGAAMRRLTSVHVNDSMAIVLDGHVYSAPTIVQPIGSSGIIAGSFSQAEVNYLIRVLAAGPLEAGLSRDPISLQEVAAEPSRGPADRPSP